MNCKTLAKALAVVAATCAGSMVSTADAATFNVFRAGSADLLGTFDAPETGGLLTSASLSVKGGVFDVLGLGGLAPVFDAAALDVDGFGAPFGAVFNSVAFMTTDIAANPILCGVGECAFSFDGSAGPVPGQWYLDYLPSGGAALSFGNYEVSPAAVPLPMTASLLLAALALLGLGSLRRKQLAPAQA